MIISETNESTQHNDTPLKRIARISALRPASDFKAPGLARHCLFAFRLTSNPKEQREKQTDAVEEFYSRLYDALEPFLKKIDKPSVIKRLRDAYPNSQTFDATFVGQETLCRFRVRIDYYTDTFALTFLIDNLSEDFSRLVDFARAIGIKIPNPNEVENELDKKRAELAAWDWLFDDVWTCEGSPFLAIDQAIAVLSGSQKAGADVIYDNRFVVHSVKRPKSTPDNDPQSSTKQKISAHLLDPETEQHLHEDIWNWLGVREHEKDLQQFIESAGAKLSDSVSELIMCAMLDGHTFFASIPPSPDGTRTFECNYIIDATRNRHQLGRLIRRINVLGELKASALIDFDNGLDEPDIKRAERDLRHLWFHLNQQGHKLDVRQANERLEEINRLVPGGLIPRLESSSYYVKPFKERMVDLRIRRFTKWQPYDEFYRRYVFQVFDRIQRTHEIYRDVQREISRKTFLLDSRATEKYQASINSNTDTIDKSIGSLRKLQETATWVPGLVLGISALLAAPQFANTTLLQLKPIGELNKAQADALLLPTVAMSLYFLIVIIVRSTLWRRQRETGRNARPIQ